MATVPQFDRTWDPQALPPAPVRRFTVAEYHDLIARGYFAADERYELLAGWLVRQTTKSPAHEYALHWLDEYLAANIPPGLLRRCQMALTLADSEPEPDLALVQGPRERYARRHPAGDETVLAIEVADSSLELDRGVKRALYARAGVPEYWIINLVDSCVEVLTEPDATGDYRRRRQFGLGEAAPLALPGQAPLAIPVAALWPPEA